MKTSQYLLATEKEIPSEAELSSHQLMIRAGMIRKIAAGIYTWLPTGIRVLKKVENIVREEMNRAGAVECLMPHLVPAELWEESKRWQKYGPELLRFKDRHQRDFCFGPTHEETFVELARKTLQSYKQLPLNIYQIQTKVRDEIRPRFGVMRAREFVMKDAYSFHSTEDSLDETYQAMHNAYLNIFKRLGLEVRAVEADAGAIGGNTTHEFQVLAQAGEDMIFYSDQSNYAANVEKATCLAPTASRPQATQSLEKFATPLHKTIQDLEQHFHIDATQAVKSLVCKNAEKQLFLLILRGDHELNEIKAAKYVGDGFEFAQEEEIKLVLGAGPGSLGPVNCPQEVKIIVDRDAACLADFVCGANEEGFHYKGVNWERDTSAFEVADLRNVVEGDQSPDGKGVLKSARGIEVGHIFKLGTEYSAKMGAKVLDQNGKPVELIMGCYGLGVGRVIAAAIEQHHDDKGILWPLEMAPFQIAIVPIGYHKSAKVKQEADELYQSLLAQGFEVLLDDRNERPGVMFADMDLIGIPKRVVISDRLLAEGTYEYKERHQPQANILAKSELLTALTL